jgi:tetratricopeptide (TPR) repeat protein
MQPPDEQDSERLLDPLEAAHLLGITAELLFAYVRNPPKARLGHDRRLRVVQHAGRTVLRKSDLDEFDAYLREPWSTCADDRPPIPSYIADYLKVECGGQCPRCGRGFKLETAHIGDYAHSLSHHHHNLIRLCSLCHEEFDAKRILPPNEIIAMKARLVARVRERLVERMQVSNLSAPSPERFFVGREIELEVLTAGLVEKRSICVRGVGGIGKTQLVLNALARIGENSTVFWVDVESFGTVAELEMRLRTALTSLETESAPAGMSSLLEGEADYIVFDGVEAIARTSPDEIVDFFSQLMSRSRSPGYVFTSQVELLGIDIELDLELRPLTQEWSLRVLEAAARSALGILDEDPDSYSFLLELAEGHPLTLKIIGGLLRFFKSARVVVERIKASGASVLLNPTRRRQTKATSLSVCIATAYSALQSEEQRGLFVLSHCPGGLFAAMFSLRSHYGISDADGVIAILAHWHLAEIENAGLPHQRIRVLSPIRAFVQHAFAEEVAGRADALVLELARDLSLWAAVLDERHIQLGDVAYGMARFAQEFSNLSHIFDESVRRSEANADFLEVIGSLASSLQVFCFLSGLSHRGMEIMRAGAAAASRLQKPAAASTLLLQLISLARRMGDDPEIRRTVQEICDLTKVSTHPDVWGDAAMARGFLAREEGRSTDAAREFSLARDYYDRSHSERHGERQETAGTGESKNERMLALALMEQASIYEHSSRPVEALRIYAQCLSLMEKTRDDVNYGCVLHQIGNCHSAMKQHEAAYRAYIEAAARFYDIGAAIHLSNSLGELGYVLIDFEPSPPPEHLLSVPLLEAGLVDMMEECVGAFRTDLNPLPAQECIRLVRKLFGVAVVVSFTPHNTLLRSFAAGLQEKFVRPLAEQLDRGERAAAEDGVSLMHIDVTAALIGSVSGPAQSAGIGQPAILPEIEHLARLCYRQYDWAWRAFRLFDWLATYLVRYRGVPGVTSESLLDAVKVAEETGTPFILQGVPST